MNLASWYRCHTMSGLRGGNRFRDVRARFHEETAAELTEVMQVADDPELEIVIQQKRQWMARSGSFLKGYVENESSYVTDRLYSPSDLGVIRFDIDFKRITGKNQKTGGHTDVLRPDIHVWC